MALDFGFFDSKNGDRKYNAEKISRYFDKLVSSGVFPNPGTNMQVMAAGGMKVQVLPGRAMLDCHWINNDSNYELTIDAADVVSNRIDAVVMKLDLNENARNITVQVKKGTNSTSPSAPSMTRTDYVKEYALAYIRVNKLTTAITQSMITDTRADTSVCGWVTGLIAQVDTSTLFRQWQDAYQAYYNASTQAFDTWFEAIKEDMASEAPIRCYENTYTTTGAAETLIPIQIAQYIKETDVLRVYVNGMKLRKATDYTITSDSKVKLTKAVKTGTPVTMEIFKGYGSGGGGGTGAGAVNGIGYGVCSTAAATTIKAVEIPDFTLVSGARITVTFDHGNTATYPQLDVNGTGNNDIRIGHNNVPAAYWGDYATIDFVYNGDWWEICNGSIASSSNFGVAKLSDLYTSSITQGGVAASQQAAANLYKEVQGVDQSIKNLERTFGAHDHDNSYYRKNEVDDLVGNISGGSSGWVEVGHKVGTKDIPIDITGYSEIRVTVLGQDTVSARWWFFSNTAFTSLFKFRVDDAAPAVWGIGGSGSADGSDGALVNVAIGATKINLLNARIGTQDYSGTALIYVSAR